MRHMPFLTISAKVIFGLLLVCYSALGCSKSEDSQQNSHAQQEADTTSEVEDRDHPPRPAPEAKVHTMTANQLHHEIERLEDEEDGHAAIFEKYKGNWLKVTGTVNSTFPDVYTNHPTWENRTRIVFEGTNEAGTTSLILNCYLDDNTPTWEQFGRGAKVTIIGALSRRGDLQYCKVIDSQGEPYPFFTATELAEAVLDDHKALYEKYKNKEIRVRGTLVVPPMNSGPADDSVSYFETDEDVKIKILYPLSEDIDFEKAGLGSEVDVLGTITIYPEEDPLRVTIGGTEFLRVVKKAAPTEK